MLCGSAKNSNLYNRFHFYYGPKNITHMYYIRKKLYFYKNMFQHILCFAVLKCNLPTKIQHSGHNCKTFVNYYSKKPIWLARSSFLVPIVAFFLHRNRDCQM